MNISNHSSHSKQLPADEENVALYVAVPVSTDTEVFEVESVEEMCSSLRAFKLIAAIEIFLFSATTCMYGFAPFKSNPLLGPPIEVIDAWGSKNPIRVLNGEYWRIFTAIFLNVGLLDLLFSVIITFCMSYHLERRWGSCKWLFVFISSGVGGNIFSTFSTNAVSVGNGGCIFGMLGAMHAEMIFAFFEKGFRSAGEDGEDGEDDEDEVDEEQLVEKQGEKEEVYLLRSSWIVIGLLFGVCTSTIVEFLPQNNRFEKDWSVLYGGMISGVIIGFFWNLFATMVSSKKSMLFAGLLLWNVFLIQFLGSKAGIEN